MDFNTFILLVIAIALGVGIGTGRIRFKNDLTDLWLWIKWLSIIGICIAVFILTYYLVYLVLNEWFNTNSLLIEIFIGSLLSFTTAVFTLSLFMNINENGLSKGISMTINEFFKDDTPKKSAEEIKKENKLKKTQKEKETFSKGFKYFLLISAILLVIFLAIATYKS